MKQTNFQSLRRAGNALSAVALLILLAVVALQLAGCTTPPPPQPKPSPAPEQAPAELPAPGTTLAAPEAATATRSAPAATASPAAAPVSVTVAAEPPALGAPNRMIIPAIGLNAPVVDVGWKVVERNGQRFTEWETANNAAGHHINSARPGEQGNVVLSGHHNTKGEVFRRISDMELKIGDLIYLYDGQGRRFTYAVDEVTDPPLLEVGATQEQRLANARYIQPTNDARVTLVTCWPYWSNTHRVIVVGKLVQ